MTRVGASAGGPRGADQADELQRPCARTSGGDAAARRQGRGTEHSLLPLRPVSRQAHSQGRPGETPPRTSPVVGPTSARDAEPSPHRPPWHEAQRTQEHQGGQTPEPPARVPRPSDRSRGPGPRQLRSAHTQSRPAPRKRNRHRDALVCPSSQQPRGPGGDALRALTLGPSSPLTSTHWRGHRPARGRALGLGGTTPRPRQARSAPRTLPSVPAARRALAVPVQNCLGRRPGLGSAVLFSLRTVTAKTLPVPFVRGAPGTSMPASTASVLPAAVPCR